MEIFSSCQQSGSKKPKLVFLEISLVQAKPIGNFIAKNKRIVFVNDLYKQLSTSALPDDPQKPSFVKEWLFGRNKTYYLYTFSSRCFQTRYYFSDGTETLMSISSSSFSLRMICLLENFSWLILGGSQSWANLYFESFPIVRCLLNQSS